MTTQETNSLIEQKTNIILDLQNKQNILNTTKNDFLNAKGSVYRGFSVRTDLMSITLNSYLIKPDYTKEVDDFLLAISYKIESEINEIEKYIGVLENEIKELITSLKE